MRTIGIVCSALLVSYCLLGSPAPADSDSWGPRLSAAKVKSKIPRPPAGASSALLSTSSSYLTNLLAFIDSLVAQFSTSLDSAVAAGVLTSKHRKTVIKQINRQQKAIKKAVASHQKKLAAAAAVSAAPLAPIHHTVDTDTLLRWSTLPARFLPRRRQGALEDLRIELGQLKSFSGLGIKFVDSLTDQFNNTVSDPGTRSYIGSLRVSMNTAFLNDIDRTEKTENRTNMRLFKRKQKGSLNWLTSKSEFTGTLQNFTNGNMQSLSGMVELAPVRRHFTLIARNLRFEFLQDSQSDHLGPTCMMAGILADNDIIFSINQRGYIAPVTIPNPKEGITQVRAIGGVNNKKKEIVLDFQLRFDNYDEGGFAHERLTFK